MTASLNQVGEQADRAAEIIRRVRRFVTKTKPLEDLIDLNAVIQDVAELMNIDAHMAKAEVALDLLRPLPPVLGDRIQLEQVLVNLMRNGFEAMRDSDCEPRRLTIRTAVESGHTILVDVSDSAGGHSPGHRRSRFRAVLHHQGRWHGNGASHQSVHHRAPWGKAVGHAESRPERQHVPFHLAH